MSPKAAFFGNVSNLGGCNYREPAVVVCYKSATDSKNL